MKLEIEIDSVRAQAYEKSIDLLGEDVVTSLLQEQASETIMDVYDNRAEIAAQIQDSE